MMSVDSTISMGLTLVGDATVEARSNAVAQSIRSTGSAYRNYAKHARHSRYAMSGVNFLTGGLISRIGTRVREELGVGETETALGQMLQQVGFLLGGGMGYDLGSRMMQPMMSQTQQATQAAMVSQGAAQTTARAAIQASSAMMGFTKAAGGFLVASAMSMGVGAIAAIVAGMVGDAVSDYFNRLTTGGGFRMDDIGTRDFVLMRQAGQEAFIARQRERAQDMIGDRVRGATIANMFVETREPIVGRELRAQLYELREEVRAAQLVTEREQRAMRQSIRVLGRL